MFCLSPNPRYSALWILVAVLALPQAASCAMPMHHPHKLAKEQIEDLEQQWRTAALTGDVPALDHLLSDDFVGISWNGQVSTKEMQLERMRTHTFTLCRLELSETRIKLLGNVAIVTSLAQLEGSNEGIEMIGMYRYTRVYQRLPSGTWKITNFEATRIPDAAERPRHAHTTHR